jgi:hypothetical protein
MIVVEKRVKYRSSNPIKRLYIVTDAHSGTEASSDKALDDCMYTIKHDDDALWVEGGDSCELILPKDKRWDEGMIADYVDKNDIAQSQEDHIFKKYKPNTKKCLGKHSGNHEYNFKLFENCDIQKHLCHRLGVTDLGYSCFMSLIFERENSTEAHKICCCGTHGAGGATTPIGKRNALKKWMNQNNANLYWYGHVHDIIMENRPYLDYDKNLKLVNREAMGVIGGCFFKTYVQGSDATYGERRLFSPTEIGYAVVTINIEEMSFTFNKKTKIAPS